MAKKEVKKLLESTLNERVNRTTLQQYIELINRIKNGEVISSSLSEFKDPVFDRSKETVKRELSNLEKCGILQIVDEQYQLRSSNEDI